MDLLFTMMPYPASSGASTHENASVRKPIASLRLKSRITEGERVNRWIDRVNGFPEEIHETARSVDFALVPPSSDRSESAVVLRGIPATAT